MRNFLLLLPLVFLSMGSMTSSGLTSSKSDSHAGVAFDVFSVKITPETVKRFSFVENSSGETAQQIIQAIGPDETFLATASIVQTNCKPLGYFQSNGQTEQMVNLENGSGNFFLKPNGALLFTDKDVVVCESSEIFNHKNIVNGIQSGPMLLHQGMTNPHFNLGSPNKAIRSGVGIQHTPQGNYVVFAISKEPVNLYDFSEFFFMKLACDNALCLESVRTVMNIPHLDNPTEQSDEKICRYIRFK